MPTEKDAAKLAAYTRLASMQDIPRRHGAFFVGETAAAATAQLLPGAAVVTWTAMLALLLEAADKHLPAGTSDRVEPWLARAFARYGLGEAAAPAPASGPSYATPKAFQAIDALDADAASRQFLKGSEITEAHWRGETPACPASWIEKAPSREEMSSLKPQSTQDRRVLRWSPTWRPSLETL